jgi:hypothetical protein
MQTLQTNNAVLIQGCTLADIEAMVNRAVEKRMKDFYENIKAKPPVLIKRKDAAERLGVSLPTLDAYAKAGFLHAQHLGGRIYFIEEEVEQYRKGTSKNEKA